MAYDTIEIYVRNLSEEEVLDWLEEVMDSPEQVQDSPIVTYEGSFQGTTVPVQITEHVQGGVFTSLWFNAPTLPWESTEACARAAHEALGHTVLCYPDQFDEPWTLLRLSDGEEDTVDERELTF